MPVLEDTTAVLEPRPGHLAPVPTALPRWQCLLVNDDVNDMEYVAETIIELTRISLVDACRRMLEAHETGAALLMVTHREHAELLQEQFRSRRLVLAIEPLR